ncbi:MAG TPA: hypothetical protein V6D17_03945, partial [Candidatus Obscuribacterales bacterium]
MRSAKAEKHSVAEADCLSLDIRVSYFHGMLKLEMIPDNIHKVAAGIILLFHFGCKDLGIEPPPPPKHPREYTFRIDTISYPGSFQTMMRSIWASSV